MIGDIKMKDKRFEHIATTWMHQASLWYDHQERKFFVIWN
jgi:hypothetical protein